MINKENLKCSHTLAKEEEERRKAAFKTALKDMSAKQAFYILIHKIKKLS